MLAVNNSCTGCGSCAAACPHNCIAMESSSEGFYYPVINSTKCIHCGICERVCPLNNMPPLSSKTTAIAAQNTDETIRQKSSSGGLFYALAIDTINRNGKVCAAVYDKDYSVTHILADSIEQLEKMCGAKYAPSRTEHCYPEIQYLLKNNIPILFVGTPCQIAGLLAYLGKNYDNLLLADIVCHGVPSPIIWKHYLKERNAIDAPGHQLQTINSRSKTTGWSYYNYSIEITYSNGTIYSVPQHQDAFMQGFVSDLYLRPSCSNCHFKGIERCSDLTLGDFWGIWNQYPEFDDNKGTSLLLLHTKKGQDTWHRISTQFRSISVSSTDAIANNPSAIRSVTPHHNRSKFFLGLERANSLQEWIIYCLKPPKENIFQRLINFIRHK